MYQTNSKEVLILIFCNIFTCLLTYIYIDTNYILIPRAELPDKYRHSN